MIRAAALIAGPILFAALFFQIQAPRRDPGVYVETGDGTYGLPGYAVGDVPAHSDVTMNTVVVTGAVHSFFIVDPERSNVAVTATSTKLYFLVVDNADATFRAEPIPLPFTIQQVNPRVYRVKSDEIRSDELRPQRLAAQYFRQILARATGSRATMELLATLVIQDSAGQRRMYSVRLGPGAPPWTLESP